MSTSDKQTIPQQVIEEACEWAIMHGVAFRQADNTARHCPFSFAPMTIERDVFAHLKKVTPLIAKLISHVSEDYEFLQTSLAELGKADTFFERLLELHKEVHHEATRQPLLLMRTDFMDDRQHQPITKACSNLRLALPLPR